ncbi:MAG: 3-deoxy-D-manno-octulosonic acid transferase [Desulfuromonadales bacterium]|nr:3-deoxy-D-manno-octulosonic acid transferase [Desulfuromonadales bacterium]
MVTLLYDLILALSTLVLVPLYLVKGVRHGKTRRGIRERLGRYAPDVLVRLQGKRVIWVHAVSVGETRAAIPLFKALRQQYPDAVLLLSNVTETGREMARGIAEVDVRIFFPFDLSWVVRRAIALIRPQIVILVETEIWPNFVRAARAANVPTVLVNGRISDRSFPRYRLLGRLLPPILDGLTTFCMQTEQDARRIHLLGAAAERVRVVGNMKFDMTLPSHGTFDVATLRLQYRLPVDGPVWVAGSTHAGEETLLAEIFLRLRQQQPDLRLVLVPRHPERARQVVEELARHQLRGCLRTSLVERTGVLPPEDVLVVDTIGEMFKLYALADFVFVGGSLVPVGGHNILEALLLEKPVVYGPYMQNFKEIARLVTQAEGGLQVDSGDDLCRQMQRLLQDPAAARRLGENGRHLLAANRGATQRTLDLIGQSLDP